MEWVIFWVLAGGAAAAASAALWGRRYFRHEIERARRIRRANRNSRP